MVGDAASDYAARAMSSPDAVAPRTEEAALEEVPFPRYLLALVQDESEMLLQPAYDLFGFLDDESDKRWDVELFSERTFEGLLQSDRQFDCIIIGLNAAWKSDIVRNALAERMPNTGLLILHQRRKGALSFLGGDLAADVVEFGEPIRRVAAAHKLDAKDEIVLNWPDSIDLVEEQDALLVPRVEAYTGLRRGAMSKWRTILEVEHGRRRVPVLLRTRTERHPPVVLCTVLIEPRNSLHAGLLGNLLLWCVSGRPDAVIVATPGTQDDARLAHRKLRMQGTKAIASRLDDPAELDLLAWPYRGIGDVVVPADADPTLAEGWPHTDPSNAREWLRNGGRIIRLGPGERVSLVHGESDAHWVTRRWAAWLLSKPPAVWHGGTGRSGRLAGSIIATRAVLRFLAAIFTNVPCDRSQTGSVAVREVLTSLEREGSALAPAAFGLHPPPHYRDPVSRLLERRMGAGSGVVTNVDATVSTTTAVLDIDALLGGDVIDAADRAAMTEWLVEEEFAEATADDRLEIARCLAQPELLEAAIDSLHGGSSTAPVTAALETKVREAVVACGAGPQDVDSAVIARRSNVEQGLRLSPLLCAHYLIGLGDLRVHWRDAGAGPANPLLEPDPRVVDRAVIAMGRHGPLIREEADDDAPAHELVSATALALFAYFGRHAVPTHVIRADAQAVPPQLVASLLNESEELRAENAIVLGQTETIRRASTLLGIAGIVLLLAVVAFTWWFLATVLVVPVLAEVGFVLGVLLFGLPGLMVALGHIELAPAWGVRLSKTFEGGISGIRERWAARLGGGSAGSEPP
jgi:hypothetical protein